MPLPFSGMILQMKYKPNMIVLNYLMRTQWNSMIVLNYLMKTQWTWYIWEMTTVICFLLLFFCVCCCFSSKKLVRPQRFSFFFKETMQITDSYVASDHMNQQKDKRFQKQNIHLMFLESRQIRCKEKADSQRPSSWLCSKTIWATTWQYQQNECVPSEDSDQPGHLPSLIRVFAVHSMGSSGPKLSSCGQWRLWSDWVNAQADLSLRYFVGFVMSRLICT